MNHEDHFNVAIDVDEFIQKALYQHEPLLLSSLMIIRALGIHKSLLKPEDYDLFCKKVYEDRNRIVNYFED